MDFKKLISRFRQFGGFKLVVEYAKLGVLWPAVKAGVKCFVKRQSFKKIYPEVLKKVEPVLQKRYLPVLQSKKEEIRDKKLDHARCHIIWFCWLQGIENAPAIVKACYNSLERHLAQGYEIKMIDSENWKEFVELPEYIVKKWEKGQIPAPSFSDLLRLQLLIKYGGTWIDSTVLCTGLEHTIEFLEADLFLFQYTRPGEEWSGNVSTWFISAHSNNEILVMVRDMLFAYWRDYDCLLDYYAIHLFFSMAAKEYPEQIAAMPYGYSVRSLTLLHHWQEKFDQNKWDKLTSNVSFHKLAFRVNEEVKNDKGNYYNRIIKEYGRI